MTQTQAASLAEGARAVRDLAEASMVPAEAVRNWPRHYALSIVASAATRMEWALKHLAGPLAPRNPP